MRPVFLLILASLGFALAACGTTEEKTVVVQPAPGQTVVVPGDGDVRQVPPRRS
jgi:hypothetical protein